MIEIVVSFVLTILLTLVKDIDLDTLDEADVLALKAGVFIGGFLMLCVYTLLHIGSNIRLYLGV